MFVVGITGGIASGKTTVTRIFQLLGIPVFIADLSAKKIIRQNQEVRQAIISAFGEQSYLPDGTYNTSYIASVVFNDQYALKKINAIVHPAVRQDFLQWENKVKAPYCIHESAILFEAGLKPLMNKVIVITANDEVRVQRIIKRDKISMEAALKRINAQMSQADRIRLSGIVLKFILLSWVN